METSRRRVLGAGLGLGLSVGVATLGSVGVLGNADPPTANADPDVRALVAGSLLGVAEAVPGASVEAHGSLAVRRLVLEDAREPDVVALADPSLFAGIADRQTLFATNALVLTHAPTADLAGSLREDWGETLAREGVRVGRTDPTADPLGYRTVMALELAERRGLADRQAVLANSTILPETGLLQTLVGGKLDAAFAYRSMAVEAGVPYVELPTWLDFSDPGHAETYASVSLDLPARTIQGAPIRYGAAATTDRGRPWLERLVGARDALQERGYAVPDSYPRRVAGESFQAVGAD